MTEPEPALEVVPDEPVDPLSQVCDDIRRQWDPLLWSPQLPYNGNP
jgi:hypothetical protein